MFLTHFLFNTQVKHIVDKQYDKIKLETALKQPSTADRVQCPNQKIL